MSTHCIVNVKYLRHLYALATSEQEFAQAVSELVTSRTGEKVGFAYDDAVGDTNIVVASRDSESAITVFEYEPVGQHVANQLRTLESRVKEQIRSITLDQSSLDNCYSRGKRFVEIAIANLWLALKKCFGTPDEVNLKFDLLVAAAAEYAVGQSDDHETAFLRLSRKLRDKPCYPQVKRTRI